MYDISVIIPVYNVERYIKKCLDSVVNQTFNNFEIIIVNDGSKQNEEKIIREYTSIYNNIRFLSKENGGQASARNLAIKEAKGKYIFFLDSDDYIENDALELLYNNSNHGEKDIILCDGFLNDEGNETYLKTNKVYTLDSEKNYLINACSPCFKLIRRSIFDNKNVMFLEGRIYEDLATVGGYLLYTNRISYVKKPLYHYILRRDSTMNQIVYNKKLEDIFYSIDNLRKMFIDNNQYNKYEDEFEYIYIMRLLHDASLRFWKFEEARSQNIRISRIINSEYPNWRKNRYYKKEGWKYKLVCELFYRRKFKILKCVLKKG